MNHKPGWVRYAFLFALIVVASPVSRLHAQCMQDADAKLFASDGVAFHNFGCSVGLEGTLALVGANYKGGGAVYGYLRTGATWLEVQQFTSSDLGAYDWFGGSLGMDGTTAVIGAPFDDDTATDSGSAYVFDWNGAAWVEVQKLVASNPTRGANFGWSVAIQDGVIVIGARNGRDLGGGSGSAYVFLHDGVQWGEHQKLLASDGTHGDWFGYSVSTDGTLVAVGACQDDDQGTDAGSAYLFRSNGATWQEEQKIGAYDGAPRDKFGYSVHVSNGQAVVGAPFQDKPRLDGGAAYVYRWSGTSWSMDQKLISGQSSRYAHLGSSVRIDGDRVALGAELDRGVGGFQGAVYTFHHDGAEWREIIKREPGDMDPAGQLPDLHGVALDLDGDTVIAGASGASGVQSDSGAAYVHYVEELGLDASPDTVFANQNLRLETCGGMPGRFCALFVISVSGSPFVQLLDLRGFDKEGRSAIGGPVPPGLSGSSANFLSVGSWGPRNPSASNPVTVTFQ